MPEMRFAVRWPDGAVEECYSPSLVVKDHLSPGEAYPIADFRRRARNALETASARVETKYGFACSRALAQLARIEAGCERFAASEGAAVTVLSFRE